RRARWTATTRPRRRSWSRRPPTTRGACDMLTVEAALGRILSSVAPLGAEEVMVARARGRALAEEIVSERALPAWDNSAMDGYAVRGAEVEPGVALPIAFTAQAGHAPPSLPPGTVARIMTGAPVPAGADAVIMREESEERDGQVVFVRAPAP